jgi:hypothetical protein
MITVRLPDMVKKVSSLVKNQSIKTFQKENQITISTEIWDFHLIKLDGLGHYVYDNYTITNRDLAEKNENLKNTILREIISKYGVTNSL